MSDELKNLDMSDLENIVGGTGAYMDKLSGLINTNARNGEQFFNVSIERSGAAQGHLNIGVPTDEASFKKIIDKAEKMGASGITFVGPDKSQRTVSLVDLKAMV